MYEKVKKRFRCKIGFHKFDLREVHFDENLKKDQKIILTSIIERCECGEVRFDIFHKNSKPTIFVGFKKEIK